VSREFFVRSIRLLLILHLGFVLGMVWSVGSKPDSELNQKAWSVLFPSAVSSTTMKRESAPMIAAARLNSSAVDCLTFG
jgi:hypothetical protein